MIPRQIGSVTSNNQCKSVIQTFYDIVKAHGGELKMETLPAEATVQAGKEGKGSEFVIQLPVV